MSTLWRSEGKKAGYGIFLYTVCIRALNGVDINMELHLTSPHSHFTISSLLTPLLLPISMLLSLPC